LDRPDNPVILAAHKAALTSISFRPDGRYVVTASRDESTMIWPVEGGEALVLPGNRMFFAGPAFGPDGLHVLTAGSAEEGAQRGVTATIWRPARLESLARERAAVAHSARLDVHAKSVFVAYDDYTVRSSSLEGQSEKLLFESPGIWVSSATPSPDGSRLAVALFNKTAKIISLTDQTEPVMLGGHSGVVRTCVWSPDGTRLLTIGDEATAWLHTLGSSKPESVRLAGHTDALTSAAWSPDGKRIVTTSMDHTARVWSADTRAEALVLKGHTAQVTGAAWTTNGRTIVTTSDDGTAQVWDAETGAPTITLNVGHPLSRIASSANGQWLGLALREGGFEVWRADGHGDAILRVKDERILAWAFVDDDRRLMTIGPNRGARSFTMDAPALIRDIESHNLDCLPEEMRVTYLGETSHVAHEQYVTCEKKHGRTPLVMEHEP